MLRLYNMHFRNCRLWSFNSEMIDKICRSYNQNLHILFDLPYYTHNWIVEDMSNGRHARQQMMARFIKFTSSLHNHKSPAVSSLLGKLMKTVQSLVGSNLRMIHLETSTPVSPGITKPFSINDHRVYKFDDQQLWKIKLLTSLIEIRYQRWEILGDIGRYCLMERIINSIMMISHL